MISIVMERPVTKIGNVYDNMLIQPFSIFFFERKRNDVDASCWCVRNEYARRPINQRLDKRTPAAAATTTRLQDRDVFAVQTY